jgi:hypothetical protein
LGEIRMNYAMAGDASGPPLLLVPAQTESWWGHADPMRLLADRYQVYAVDLRSRELVLADDALGADPKQHVDAVCAAHSATWLG